MSGAAIETHGLTTSYGEHRGIVDVDLEVRAGEIFGFLGPNGAGKTTLIRTLLDLLRPTTGSATILGLDSHRDSLAVRRRLAYLPGDLALYERLTARHHLHWLGELAGGADDLSIDAVAERFGLDLDRPISELSKGNRQKVGLCQAFMRRADLLVMDEPTAGLDPLVQHEFQNAIREVVADGRTVFLSSHLLDEVQQVTDRVAIIREGRIVTVQSVDEIRSRSIRRITVRFATSHSFDALDRVPGVRDMHVDGASVSLTLDGSMDPLIKALASREVVDLVSEPLDLDDVFLSYYEAPES